MVNVPLLRKVLEHVTNHPDEWDQAHWAAEWGNDGIRVFPRVCGTAYCVAGHVAVLTGHEPYWCSSTLSINGVVAEANMTTEGQSIAAVATDELGLTVDEAQWLFNSSNSLSDLWDIASDLTQGEITPPNDLRNSYGIYDEQELYALS